MCIDSLFNFMLERNFYLISFKAFSIKVFKCCLCALDDTSPEATAIDLIFFKLYKAIDFER